MNSIEAALGGCPHSLTAEIALMLRSHYRDGKLLIVVEGPTDKEIYGRFYDSHDFDVYRSTKHAGCINLPDMLRALNTRYSERLIAIKDADFDHVDGMRYDDLPNLFLTDSHDLETMMLTKAFSQQLEIFLGVEKAEELIRDSIKDIIHLSYIKWMNKVKGAKLEFKKSCRVGSCYNGMRCVDIATWLGKIYSSVKNSGKPRFSVNDVEKFEEDKKVDETGMLLLANGHDIVAAITNKANARYKKNVSADKIADILSKSYTNKDYSETSLCSSISSWISTHQRI